MLSASSSFRTTTVSKVHSQKQYRDASVFVLHSFLLPLVFSPTSLPSTPVELARSKTRKLECLRPTYCVPLPVSVCNNERYEKTMRYKVEDTEAHCYQTFSENVKNPTLLQRGGLVLLNVPRDGLAKDRIGYTAPYCSCVGPRKPITPVACSYGSVQGKNKTIESQRYTYVYTAVVQSGTRVLPIPLCGFLFRKKNVSF